MKKILSVMICLHILQRVCCLSLLLEHMNSRFGCFSSRISERYEGAVTLLDRKVITQTCLGDERINQFSRHGPTLCFVKSILVN